MDKKCPKCGNTNLLRLYSLNLLICTDCRIEIVWNLKEKQEPLVKAQR